MQAFTRFLSLVAAEARAHQIATAITRYSKADPTALERCRDLDATACTHLSRYLRGIL